MGVVSIPFFEACADFFRSGRVIALSSRRN